MMEKLGVKPGDIVQQKGQGKARVLAFDDPKYTAVFQAHPEAFLPVELIDYPTRGDHGVNGWSSGGVKVVKPPQINCPECGRLFELKDDYLCRECRDKGYSSVGRAPGLQHLVMLQTYKG